MSRGNPGVCFVIVEERVIAALDMKSAEEALSFLDGVPRLRFAKVGMQLFYREGLSLVRELKDRDLRVFLDLKIHDIPNTAFGAVQSLSTLGCDIINVHCAGGLEMMRRAREAVTGDTKLIGVTILTSLDEQALHEEIGLAGDLQDHVLRYASLAQKAGLHGVVCSPWETALLKQQMGVDFLTVTPGVRPRTDDAQDQKRIMTPGDAVRHGSDYLVIGRPLTQAADPAEVLDGILREIEVNS